MLRNSLLGGNLVRFMTSTGGGGGGVREGVVVVQWISL